MHVGLPIRAITSAFGLWSDVFEIDAGAIHKNGLGRILSGRDIYGPVAVNASDAVVRAEVDLRIDRILCLCE